MTDRTLRRKYLEFNRRHFRNRLPTKTITLVFRRQKDAGEWVLYTDDTQAIFIASRKEQPWIVWVALLHEMIHVHQEGLCNYDHLTHGPSFQKDKRRLLRTGAYDSHV